MPMISPTRSSWAAMLARCNNQYSVSYAEYGAKGIRVCQQWHHFGAFLKDMGERPDGTTLDRIDNSKGYEPGNCRWATRSEQNRNRRKFVRGKVRKKVVIPKSPRPRGRPPLGDAAATARVEFRCTPQEKAGYRRKAGKPGVSAWLKRLADEA